MNRAHLRSANALCGRLEALQNKLAAGKRYGEAGRNAEVRRTAYESVARAKNAMLDAIRAMESAS